MRVRMIIGQYPVRYEGELMPNVLAAWDEYAMDDNHEGYQEELAKFQGWVQSGDLAAVREMDILVPDDSVLGLFEIPTVKIKIERI